MKTMNVLCFTLVLLFSAASAFGQSRVVLDQSTNAVAFSRDDKSWGLEVNGNEVIEPGYKTVAFQSGLFKLEDWDNNWMVIDKDGNNKVLNWVKASDVKISEGFVLFEKYNGGVEALIYDRSTWTVVKAQATTYDAMAAEIRAKYEGDGSTIPGYENLAEENDRIYRTQPRVVHRDGKAYLMFRDVQFENADKITILTKNFDDDKWYFLVEDGGKAGVLRIDKGNLSVKDASYTIKFQYNSIVTSKEHWQLLDCTLADGKIEKRWWWGKTIEQQKIPETMIQK